VIWRSAIIAGYVALAILITVAYGGRGLATLVFFYFCAGAWVVFLVAWNWAARSAGRWNMRRLETPHVRR
jgi:cation transporter-like permease